MPHLLKGRIFELRHRPLQYSVIIQIITPIQDVVSYSKTLSHLRRRIHEVELKEILHSERLEQQDYVSQVGPLQEETKSTTQFIDTHCMETNEAKRDERVAQCNNAWGYIHSKKIRFIRSNSWCGHAIKKQICVVP